MNVEDAVKKIALWKNKQKNLTNWFNRKKGIRIKKKYVTADTEEIIKLWEFYGKFFDVKWKDIVQGM